MAMTVPPEEAPLRDSTANVGEGASVAVRNVKHRIADAAHTAGAKREGGRVAAAERLSETASTVRQKAADGGARLQGLGQQVAADRIGSTADISAHARFCSDEG